MFTHCNDMSYCSAAFCALVYSLACTPLPTAIFSKRRVPCLGIGIGGAEIVGAANSMMKEDTIRFRIDRGVMVTPLSQAVCTWISILLGRSMGGPLIQKQEICAIQIITLISEMASLLWMIRTSTGVTTSSLTTHCGVMGTTSSCAGI